MEDYTLEELMELCKEIYACTRGAYFTINCNNEGWKLQIPSSTTLFKGDLREVLEKYIIEITTNRDEWKNPNNPKDIKKYCY